MADIYIYGDIWYYDAAYFVDSMVRAQDEDVTVCINSDGGDVFEAAAMYGAIARHKGKVTCRVDGIAASAAAYICMAADEVVMSPGSFMMIHLPWAVVAGNRNDLDAMRRDLDEVEAAMVAAHAAKSGKTPDEIREMFEMETLMGSQTAVDEGFADRVEGGEPSEVAPAGEDEAREMAAKGAKRTVEHLPAARQAALAARNIAAARAQNIGATFGNVGQSGPPVAVNIYANGTVAPPSEPSQGAQKVAAMISETIGTITPTQDLSPEAAEIESGEPEPVTPDVEPGIPEESPMPADLNSLRAQRGDKANAVRAMVFDGDAVKTLTDEDKTAIGKIEGEIAALDERIETAERVENRIKALSVPVVEASAAPTVAPEPKENVPATAQFGQYLHAFAKGRGVHSEMVRIAASKFGERSPIVAVLNTTDDASVVPDPYANEIIELLRAQSVIMMAGPRMVNLPNGKLTIPAGATGATASYTGEATNITASEPTFRQVILDAKKLTALVPISNEISNDSVGNLDTWVREDVVGAMADTMDLSFLRADGTGNLPTGLLSLANAAALVAANATVNLANITNDLGKLELVLANNNVRGEGSHVWFMSPRSTIFLRDLRDGNGNLAYPTMSQTPMTLRGKRVYDSSQIPINLGGGTNESEIYLVAMQHVMVGEAQGMQIAVSEEASYFDGAALQSAFAQDLTLIRAITRHDIDIRQVFAVAVLQDVLWGS